MIWWLFYEQSFNPETMILGIIGDFDSAKMRSLIEEKFGKWSPKTQPPKAIVPTASQAKQGGVFFVNQPQLTQSYVQMGHLGWSVE